MMTRIAAVVFLLVLGVSPSWAQTCTPTPLVLVYWGSYGVEHIPESSVTTGWVPDSEVWLVTAAAASIDGPGNLPLGDYILLDDTRYPATGALWYLSGLVKAMGTNTTPVVVASRPHILASGHRLSVRTNIDIPATARMGIHATGWTFPAACLSRLLGLETSAGSGSASIDYTVFKAALLDAAGALQGVVDRVP